MVEKIQKAKAYYTQMVQALQQKKWFFVICYLFI